MEYGRNSHMTILEAGNADKPLETPKPVKAIQWPRGDIEQSYSSEPPWLVLKMRPCSSKNMH
ncbi:hypothetical protein [Agrobacterium rubi]|uniref:hypothetical protein n=1 Tax=Agrobacterium rubi TaxID=28099 RepID=UPI001038C704|nr:hypothetical protein [Agrobacterium rubi]MBP1877105.1 hypothetical protein [Agrobacterium rubi]